MMATDIGNIAPTIRDNIDKMENEFNLGSFLSSTEAGQYLAELPGIQDIVDALEKIWEFAKELIDKILQIIEMILDFIGSLFDAFMSSDFAKLLLGLLESSLFGFGLPIGMRSGIMSAIQSSCTGLGTRLSTLDGGLSFTLEHFALSALLIGLLCSSSSNGFSTVYNAYINSEPIIRIKTDLTEYRNEYDTILYNTNPEIADLRAQLATANVAYNTALINSTNDTIVNLYNENQELREEVAQIKEELRAFIEGTKFVDEEQLNDTLATLEERISQNNDAILQVIEDEDETELIELSNAVTELENKYELYVTHYKEKDTTLQELENKINTLESDLQKKIKAINYMFSNIIVATLPNIQPIPTIPTENYVNMFEDIASTPPGNIVGEYAGGLGNMLVTTLDGSITQVESFIPPKEYIDYTKEIKDPVVAPTVPLPTTTPPPVYVADVDPILYQRFTSALTVLDRSFILTPKRNNCNIRGSSLFTSVAIDTLATSEMTFKKDGDYRNEPFPTELLKIV